MGALLAVGCSQPSPFGTSRLGGTWYAAGPGLRVLMGQDGIRTETPQPQPGQAVLMIRNDGSLDLSNTILGGIEGFEGLRKKGDRVYLGSASDQSTDFFQVESSTSSPTRSELIIGRYYKDLAQNSKTIFSAQLASPGRLLFFVGSYGPGATAGVETAVLQR